MEKHEDRSMGWQLEKRAPEAYEQYLVPPMFKPWADRLIDHVELQKADSVLDVGCGTGIVARHVASRVGDHATVIGVDVNAGMLDVATEIAAESRPAIEWRRGEATNLPFPAERFDVVVCQQALQFVADPTAALREMRRVLVPNGRVAVSVWRPLEFNPGYVQLAAALKEHVGADAETILSSPFPAWEREDLRTRATDAGLCEPSITIEIGSMRYPSAEAFLHREAASSPLSESIRDLTQGSREALVREVRHALREYTDDDGIAFPMESHVLTARR